MISAIVGGITQLGGQWLKNKQAEGQATSDYKIGKLKARTGLVHEQLKMEFAQHQSAATLDELAVRQSAKSWFDEAIAIIPIGILLFMIYEAVSNGGGSEQVIDVLERAPLWLQVWIGIVYVRYLGFRNLLRMGMKMWLTKKGIGIKADVKHEG